LIYDPDFRITSREALKHAFFKEYYESEKPRISSGRNLSSARHYAVEPKEIPSASYLKKPHPESEHTIPVPVKIEEKKNVIATTTQHTLQENVDNSDSYSAVSSNSTGNNSLYAKKAVNEERVPNRLRRNKQKDYKINSNPKVFKFQ
jgi:hypothetical protein